MAKPVKKTYEKELYILRGLPGSGKTTLAKSILDNGAGIIHSSDDFFTNKRNIFRFDKSKLNEALKFNQQQCEESCRKGILRIIVDDNHVKRWSVKPIIETGKKYNYKIIIREPETSWWKTRNVNEMAKRSRHNYQISVIKKLLEMWDTDFSIESILKEKIPNNKEEIIDQLLQNPIRSSISGKSINSNSRNNDKKINSRHNHNGPPPKGNLMSGRNNYVAQKQRNLDNYRSQPYYGSNRGRDNSNHRSSYYEKPPNNNFDRNSGGRNPYKPGIGHDRGYYSTPPPPLSPRSSGNYRNSYPPYDRYDRNDNLPPLSQQSYDRYDRNDNPPYYDRYNDRGNNNMYDSRNRNRGDNSLPPPPPLPPPHHDRYNNKRMNSGGAPIYDKYDRNSSNPSSQYYNRRDPPPPPPPPPMYDHRDRRNNHSQMGYDHHDKGGLPPPGPRYDRRDHNPPNNGYYGKNGMNDNNRNYYRGESPPPHLMNNPPPYNYKGGWKRK
ncbi:hypothetical protein BCR32DRAFT_272480 [Anaeromyces robustus]|uniref:P-loop containing nucleoside triphosphate hydrolase protein n=1 Tax=Anaeromyces robustus TaxID=1754192 RepID=A0A1Y1W662_9FUNG|nr:hypothetical protein BCR32DRAFT_272480 [Anaeromyces robustus]|eukprot:ORX68875.1 hypothetical protein BCR32DRAFT_272480 [Anaeromyces robustus]